MNPVKRIETMESYPPAHDIDAMAAYAKQHYNTPLGKATAEKYSLDYCPAWLSGA
jgi:hypothetical protein